MPEETETVTGTPAQEPSTDDQKDSTEVQKTDDSNGGKPGEVQVSSENDSQPSVEACILKTSIPSEAQSNLHIEPEPCTSKTENVSSKSDQQIQAWSVTTSLRPKSPEVIATEAFLLNEQGSTEPVIQSTVKAEASEVTIQPILKAEPSAPETEPVPKEIIDVPEPAQVPEKELVPHTVEPRTPANSEASEGGAPSSGEEQKDFEPLTVAAIEVYTTINGDISEEPPKEILPARNQEPAPQTYQTKLTNGQSNGECKLEPRKVQEPDVEEHHVERNQVLIDTIANELRVEDYKLPDVVEVKKHFEYVAPTHNDVSTPPKKGALSTRLDAQSVKQAYEDVRFDGSETQWAVFKFEGPTIVTSAKGSDFSQFKSHFGEDQRAFGYIRVQTGDEMSKRAKFLFVTWVGPSVSVLKRAKMSTDKALMKGILSNFAVELQTENISDINLQNFETELDKAAGAHYGTGVRG